MFIHTCIASRITTARRPWDKSQPAETATAAQNLSLRLLTPRWMGPFFSYRRKAVFSRPLSLLGRGLRGPKKVERGGSKVKPTTLFRPTRKNFPREECKAGRKKGGTAFCVKTSPFSPFPARLRRRKGGPRKKESAGGGRGKGR